MNKRAISFFLMTLFLLVQSACVCDNLRIEKNYYTATTNAYEALLPSNLTIAKDSYTNVINSGSNFVKLSTSYANSLQGTDASKSKIEDSTKKIDALCQQIIDDLQTCGSSITGRDAKTIEASLSSVNKDLDQIRSSLNSHRSYLNASNPQSDTEKQVRIDIINLIDSLDSDINSQLIITISKLNSYLSDLKLRKKYESECEKHKCS